MRLARIEHEGHPALALEAGGKLPAPRDAELHSGAARKPPPRRKAGDLCTALIEKPGVHESSIVEEVS